MREPHATAINAVAFLLALADELDSWAYESGGGGWSTHQVERNIKEANNCRRMAARLQQAIRNDP